MARVGCSQGTIRLCWESSCCCGGRGEASLLGEVSPLPPPAEIHCGKLNYHVQKHHKPHSFQWGLWLAQCSAQTTLLLLCGSEHGDGAASGDVAEPWASWVRHLEGLGSYNQPGEVQPVENLS